MRIRLTYLPIGAVLALGAALRLFNLSQNGYSREYYAAAVRSMLQSWHNTFYNSFDPGGFVSLDKPPVGIWVQALFAKVFGFSALNTLLPQVLLGLTAILLVYLFVRRTFGESAAVIAAAILAVNPANVAVDRSNNLESCLIVILLAAVYFAMRAAETGRLRHFAGAMLVIGIGFNVKMAAALVIAPTIAIVFFLFNRQISLSRHFFYQCAAGSLMIAVALSWVIAFDLTPSDKRPYAGSTKNNSMLELVLKHNGTDRFATPTNAKPPASLGETPPQLYDNSPTGPLRLFRAVQTGQFSWLLPFALFGIFFGWRRLTRAQRIALAIWTGWLATYWIVFSAAGGPFHTYYLAVLAPPLAALAGIGAAMAWQQRDKHGVTMLATFILLTALWQAWIYFGQTKLNAPLWLQASALTCELLSLLSVALLLLWRNNTRATLAVVPAFALLALPVLASLSVVAIRPNVIAPVATLSEYTAPEQEDAARANPRRRDASRAKLISFLLENRGNEKFIVAVENALIAAPIIIATGEPVITLGGYLGTDPILTPEKLSDLAKQGLLRFVMTGGLSLTDRSQPQEIALRNAIRKSGTIVQAARWSTAPQLAGKTFRVRLGGTVSEMEFPTLYDLSRATAR